MNLKEKPMRKIDVLLAQPRGFCAGVVRAVDIVELALDNFSAPIYVYHEIVHNRHVVESLRQRGAVFVEDIADVPEKAVCVFSAHGVAAEIVQQAQDKELHIVDATCPLVTKVHKQAKRYVKQGCCLIIVGHVGHPEVEGTRGQIDGDVHILCSVEEVQTLQLENTEKLAYVTQTTLSVDDTRDVIAALRQRFPGIQGPDLNDICYATQNRQNAVRELAQQVDILLVVGAKNSSNSNRLREVGLQLGIPAYLIDDYQDLQDSWFSQQTRVGLTAGASAPEKLVQEVIDCLQQKGIVKVNTLPGEIEKTSFKLPLSSLRNANRHQNN